MAPTSRSATGRERPNLRPSAWPWWGQVLAVYGVTRAWSAVAFLLAAAGQPASYWAPPQPGYGTFVGLFWDGSWYRAVAEDGYPAGLPRDPDGTVHQNAWAFFPLFPLLVRALMAVTGGSWAVLAPTCALVLGAAGALVLDRLVQEGTERRAQRSATVAAAAEGGADRRLALGTVLLVGLLPAAPVLQAAYAESLALLLVVSTIWLLMRRAYLAAVPVVVALGFTRAVALPMAVVVVVHLLTRWRDHRAGRDRLDRAAVLRLAALAVAAATAGVAWPVLVGRLSGVPDAYVRTQAAWRGTFSSAPVVPWVQMADFLLGAWGLPVLVLLLVAAFGLALSRHARAAGVEVQAWGVAYLGYLVLVAFPQSSVIRFLLLAISLPLATAGLARTRGRLAVLAALLAAAQLGWVIWVWQVTAATSWPP
jgi:hypothetical protein